FAIFPREAASAVDWINDPQPFADVRHGGKGGRALLGTEGVFGKSPVKMVEDQLLCPPVGCGAYVRRRVRYGLEALVVFEDQPAGSCRRFQRRFQFALERHGVDSQRQPSNWLADFVKFDVVQVAIEIVFQQLSMITGGRETAMMQDEEFIARANG